VALLANTKAADLFEHLGLPSSMVAVLVAPFVEESMKALGPILLFAVRRQTFSGLIDGLVYCGLSATGFAMVENILYLGGHGYAGGAEVSPATGALLALAVFIGRVPLTGFAHPLFTSMTGLGLGFAARSPRKAVRVLAPITGLLAAMTLHASWNLMASYAAIDAYWLLYGYFAVFMPIFFLAVGLVLWIRSWEGRLAERVLPIYAAADWFSPPEVVALGALGRRLSARAWARKVAGQEGLRAMKQYQYAATRLALLRDGLERGLYASPAAVQVALADEHRLLSEIDRCRRVFTGRDPLTPSAWWSAGAYQIRFPDGVVRQVPEPPSPVVPVPYPVVGAVQRPG
jgi:hypothetical protein